MSDRREKLYIALASHLTALANCRARGLTYGDKWLDRINTLVANMPSGSGIDCGTKIDFDRSNGNKLVFIASFHHMDQWGCYDGWTEHEIIVKPSLAFGFDIRITGRNRNDIKDYLHEVYDTALRDEIDPYPDAE